jgi:hypothetical protein
MSSSLRYMTGWSRLSNITRYTMIANIGRWFSTLASGCGYGSYTGRWQR